MFQPLKITQTEFLNIVKMTAKYCLIVWISLVSLGSSAFKAAAQSSAVDYSTLLGSHWQAAETWVSNNESWIRPVFEKYKIPYDEAMAVVFPEVVRFSIMRDSREKAILKALYVNNGTAYADFSIGILRMKPSFAEEVRKELSLSDDSRLQKILRRRHSYMDERKYRAMITTELEDIRVQISYVTAYMLLYANRPAMPEGEERIRLLAAGYNETPVMDADGLRLKADEKLFGTDPVTEEKYFYCDVALFWYRQHHDD